ncbi:MAG: hypothetical protein KBC57_07475 [Neisseriaceae bacterium]|nr:hypothetical protein [Neisseriaceae bacterium]MBP6862181.1 hypothetical protein [Neisseriaceae bacterium]
MAKLIIKRSWHFISLKRVFKVFVDGERVASVKNADTIELDVAPGEHVVRTGINAFEGLSPKLKINLQADQTLVLNTAPNNMMILSILLAVIGGILLAAGFTMATELWFYGAGVLAIGLILAVKFAIRLTIEPNQSDRS